MISFLAPKVYSLSNGRVFTIPQKILPDFLTQDSRGYFVVLKRYRRPTWYKPQTWFAVYWDLMYVESKMNFTEIEKQFLGDCILMAAREGFYMIDQDELESTGMARSVLKKLGADNELIERVERGV